MMLRRTLLSTLVAAVSLSTPGHADEIVGIAGGSAGAVCASSFSAGQIRSEELVACCSYVGLQTLTGRIQFVYSGTAVAYSTSTDQPELTVLTCTMVSPAQGLPGEEPTQSKSMTIAGSGGASAVADLTPAWPLRPVKVCISGYTTFGPVEPTTRTVATTCRVSTL